MSMPVNANDDDELLAIAILIDDLRHEQVANRLASVHKLAIIAQALGPARTCEELIPYLAGLCVGLLLD